MEKSREKISGSDEEIEKFLRRDDKRKQDYYRKFAGGDWSDATNYDLCLNAGKLGFEKCVDAIWRRWRLWELNKRMEKSSFFRKGKGLLFSWVGGRADK